jgi:putative PEP-CTERM system histidine kinase
VQLNLRHFISRHFRRPLYDYQSIWHQFSAATASQVGQSEYSRAVVKLLAEIFQTLSVTLWVVEERREELTLAASTSLSDRQARESGLTPTEASLVIRQLRRHPGPLDLGNSREDWAMALRRCHPDFFSRNSQRICLPIVAAGEPQAVVILGDRVGAIKFTLQDLDLLKSIGSHISSGLMNVRLSHRLLLTREHEAFQAMATFFVHDLKNAATTLNLMLRNLPDHFDDPAFREDALRGVAKSVAHINNLISRLSQLRHELKMQSVPSDLNAIISEVLADQETVEGIELEKQLGKLPLISLDKSQIAKVITNLVLNAREAMGTGGRLRVETNLTGAWASAAVTDTGCGMTPEFIAQSLFRPFQTTKKNGLGIGMFQSKMIVEAHGGTFAVESSPGQGTTFRVFLPLLPSPH